MKALKNYIINNKLLVSITSAVTLFSFIVFTVIAATSNSTGTSSNNGTSDSTSSLVADNGSSDTSSSTTTKPAVTTPPGEETTEDPEVETTTKKPTVDPNTLPYMVKVNRAANCATVYEKDADGNFTVPVKAITVSCGKDMASNSTPLGTYQTIENYDWRKMVDGTYGQYAYRIVGSILFHSVPYYSVNKGDLEWEEYNKLGSAASLGCVRMTVADALWLMENCPIGTKVIIYDDAENPGPLGKPDTIKIPADSEYRGWDPTDPDPENPWHNFHASITHPSTKTITVETGATMDQIRSYFKGYDKCGNDISEKLVISGSLDLNVAGVYTITVSIEDATGSTASVEIHVYVKEKQTEPETPEDTTPGEIETPEDTTTGETETPEDTTTGETETPEESTTPGEDETPEQPETPEVPETPETPSEDTPLQ